MGMGHVTNCFVHMQGTDLPDGFVETENEPGVHKPIRSLQELASALQDEHVATNSTVKVFWPKEECPLLDNDLVIIDSPGCEIDKSIDASIKENCQDSDIFIIVLNAECLLTLWERAFFRTIKAEISKANVFILINRWDLIDNDPAPDKVKRQHLRSCLDFLREETNAESESDSSKKIFFVSALERLRKTNTDSAAQKSRHEDFALFEETLASCALSSAFNWKIVPHVNTIMELCKKLSRDLDGYSDRLTVIQKKIKIKEDDAKQKHDSLMNKFEAAKRRVQEEIQITVSHLGENISSALRAAIHNVPAIVTKFDNPTPIDITATEQYIKELSLHLVEQITLHVRQSCEGNMKAKLDLVIDKLNGLLVSYLPVGHREYVQHAFNFQIKWDLRHAGQLNDIKVDVPALAHVSQWLQTGKYAFIARNKSLTVLGMGAYAGGILLEKKLVSDLKDKYIANAMNVLGLNTTYYMQDISSQITQFLGKKLTMIEDQCNETLHKSRMSERTEIADLMRYVNQGEQRIGLLRKKIHNLQGRVELHLVPMRATSVDQEEYVAVCSGRSEVVTKGFLLAAFCRGLGIVMLYYLWYG